MLSGLSGLAELLSGEPNSKSDSGSFNSSSVIAPSSSISVVSVLAVPLESTGEGSVKAG